jgi:NADH-quinone oxidoreductase subunit L
VFGDFAGAVDPNMEWILMGVSVAGAILGITIALGLYKKLSVPEKMAKQFAFFHRLLENKWYVDEIYEAVFIKPILWLSQGLWKGFDVAVIDRIVLSFGRVSNWTGQTARVIQTGSIQIYALMLLIGVVATVGYLVYGMA